jgi:hypothetical protein
MKCRLWQMLRVRSNKFDNTIKKQTDRDDKFDKSKKTRKPLFQNFAAFQTWRKSAEKTTNLHLFQCT